MAPYIVGDPVVVEGHEGKVEQIACLDKPEPFGRRWLMRVDLDTDFAIVTCDDNGRSRKRGSRVDPSFKASD